MKKKAAAPPAKPVVASASHRPFAKLAKLAARASATTPSAGARGKAVAPPPPPPAPPPEDDDAWVRARLSGVRPLAARPERIPKTASSVARRRGVEPSAAASADEAEARAHLRKLVEGTVPFEVIDDGASIEGHRADTDARSLRHLRRGELPIDRRLDLHGLREHEARREVERFVASRRAAGDRVLLVVHGKGLHSPGGQGVLRGEIGAWLSASIHVRAFASARPADGGAGATYVLLRP